MSIVTHSQLGEGRGAVDLFFSVSAFYYYTVFYCTVLYDGIEGTSEQKFAGRKMPWLIYSCCLCRSIGEMGMGVAKLLIAHNYRVVTNVEGRRWGLPLFLSLSLSPFFLLLLVDSVVCLCVYVYMCVYREIYYF
jgi:hypothetical protein